MPRRPLLLATDFTCSADVAWAMKELGVAFRHVFASETVRGTRRFVAQNAAVRPEVLYRSVHSRICDFAAQTVAPPKAHVDLYAVGAFSGEADLAAVVRYISDYRPKTVLVRKHCNRSIGAEAALQAVDGYSMHTLLVESSALGLPQQGQYSYILMVQDALLRNGRNLASAEAVLRRLEAHAAATASSTARAAEELLDASSGGRGSQSEVATSPRHLTELTPMTSATTTTHRRARTALGVAVEDDRYFWKEGIHVARWVETMREADLIQIHALACWNKGLEPRFVDAARLIDLQTDASSPTVPATEGFSHIWSYRLRRMLSTRDKLVLKGFRPERLDFGGVLAPAARRLACITPPVHVAAAVALAALSVVELDRLMLVARPLSRCLPMAVLQVVVTFLGLPWEPDAWPISM